MSLVQSRVQLHMLAWSKYTIRPIGMIGQMQAMGCPGRIRSTSKEEGHQLGGWKCAWMSKTWHKLDRLGWHVEFNCSKASENLKCGKRQCSKA
jgi:hypothetical protein